MKKMFFAVGLLLLVSHVNAKVTSKSVSGSMTIIKGGIASGEGDDIIDIEAVDGQSLHLVIESSGRCTNLESETTPAAQIKRRFLFSS